MPDIFISYRRSDSAGHARLLYRELKRHYREERLFFDRSSIEAGSDFPSVLHDAVANSQIVLAVIAPDWLNAKIGDQRRLLQPDDFVRRELALALQLNKKIIPVLCDDTPFPPAAELPPDLQGLGAKDGQPLRGKGAEFDASLQLLLQVLAGSALPDFASQETAEPPEWLPHLCDRDTQESELRLLLKNHRSQGVRRPIVCLLYGDAEEAHREFVERVGSYTVKRRWSNLLPNPNVLFKGLKRPPRATTPAAFAEAFRLELCDSLAVGPYDADEPLRDALGRLGFSLIAPFLTVRAEEEQPGQPTYFELIRDYWRAFPDLPENVTLISLVLMKLTETEAPATGNFLGGLWQRLRLAKSAGRGSSLRERIAAYTAAPSDPRVVSSVLTELPPARRGDVEDWAVLDEVRRFRPVLEEDDLKAMFGERDSLPMERLHGKLDRLLRSPKNLPASSSS